MLLVPLRSRRDGAPGVLGPGNSVTSCSPLPGPSPCANFREDLPRCRLLCRGGFHTVGDFLAVPVVFFGPPIALLLCGVATGWAIRGFKAEKVSGPNPAPAPSENVVPLQRTEGSERDGGPAAT